MLTSSARRFLQRLAAAQSVRGATFAAQKNLDDRCHNSRDVLSRFRG